MSACLPPLGPCDPFRLSPQPSVAPRAPVGIANTPTVLTSCAPTCVSYWISECFHWVADCLVRLWFYVLSFFCSMRLSAEDSAWNALLARVNSGFPSPLNHATLQRICGNTRRTFVSGVEGNELEANYASIVQNSTDASIFTQLDMDLNRCAEVYVNGQRFTDSHDIATALERRGLEGKKLLKVLSCLSQGGCSTAFKVAVRLFAVFDGPEEVQRYPFQDVSEATFRTEVDFEGEVLRSIRITNHFIVEKFSPRTPLFKVSTVTIIDAVTGSAIVVGATRPLIETEMG